MNSPSPGLEFLFEIGKVVGGALGSPTHRDSFEHPVRAVDNVVDDDHVVVASDGVLDLPDGSVQALLERFSSLCPAACQARAQRGDRRRGEEEVDGGQRG